jgi:hypothetical protein
MHIQNAALDQIKTINTAKTDSFCHAGKSFPKERNENKNGRVEYNGISKSVLLPLTS